MRRSRALTAAFGLALVVQACSPGATTAPSSGGTSAPSVAASAPASAAAAVELTLLEHQKPRQDVLAKILPICEASLAKDGLNVKVNLTGDVVEDEQFRQNVTILYQGDNPPDITSYPGAWVPDFATAGYLLDISDKLAAWPDWSAHFYQVLRDRAKQADGKYYSMPRHGTVIELFIRKDVLDQNGISTAQPNSWQELIDRLTELHGKTKLAAITIPAGDDLGWRDLRRGFHPHLQRHRRQALRRRHEQVDRQEPGPDRRLQLLQHAPEGRAPADQGAARSDAVGADQVRRVHRHHRRRQDHPGRTADHDPGVVGLGLRLGARSDRRPADPRDLRWQGRHVGLPEQGCQRQLRVGRRGLDVDDLREVQAS